MSSSDLIVKPDGEVAVQTGLVAADDRVERIKSLEDLIMSIYYRTHEIRAIFAYNHSRGIRMEEMGPYDAPMDYKLNQLDGDLMKLRAIFGLEEKACSTQTKNSPIGGQLNQDSKRLIYSKRSSTP